MEPAQLIDALSKAHRAHLLAQLQSEDHWQAQMTHASEVLADKPLGSLVDSDILTRVVDNWLQLAFSAEGVQPVVEAVSLQVWEAASQDPATVAQLLREEHFDAVLEQVLKLQSLREKAIHAAMSHPLVSEMVSEMLYTGIKNFLLEENALAKLPGVSSVMKMGRKSVVGKAMGGMEENIRDYLRKNIRVTLRTGEQWLNRQLTNERIEQLARDGYRRMAPLKPADALKLIPDGTVTEVVRQGCLITDESAKLEYTRRLVSVGIVAAVKELETLPLGKLLEGMKISEQQVRDLLAPALAQGAKVLVEAGVLEPLLQWTLDDFYQSDACKDAISQA
ncbi:hypothetical protein A11A3_02682 [Alcanivorax hongdengensis A-11-3]|uniref:Uncharacterized protein n=1 Tax=Alcanivorax hongdengensis A-11-3 TaxID=1177179 RepID=L0WG98_9GAMM|nr:hypothetical protein [Alcanivorax hongdengensis]EKF75739.1 hypothetical protein A11A3_02682 [Alcanivorax hongdengensis A-11-3]